MTEAQFANEPKGPEQTESPYEGIKATPGNIAAATSNVKSRVLEQVIGFDGALYLGTMTEQDVHDELKDGVYAYVFLQDLEDESDWIAVSLVHGGEVKQTKMSREEMRTWHPFHDWGAES